MDSIKGTISSVTGAGSTQAADGNDSSTTSTSTSTRDLKPTPPETGLQSRGQTEHSGSGSFLGEMKNMVNSAMGASGTEEEKELAVNKGPKGQVSEEDKNAVQQAGDEQISEFIRDKYHSQAGGGLLDKDG